MGHAALQRRDTLPATSTRALTVINGGKAAHAALVEAHRSIPSEILVLGAILALLQVLDGVLTGIGMYHYGTSMEGNLLLRALMGVIGYLPALVVVKTASIGLIGVLCLQATKVQWLKPAFIGVIALYTVMAVVPWTYILLMDLFA